MALSLIGDWIGFASEKIFGLFKIGATSIVSRVLGAYGLSLVSVNALLPQMKAWLAPYITGLPAPALQLLGAVGADVVMSMILSALTIRWGHRMIMMPTSVAQQLGATRP